jgi:hypothetical protein
MLRQSIGASNTITGISAAPDKGLQIITKQKQHLLEGSAHPSVAKQQKQCSYNQLAFPSIIASNLLLAENAEAAQSAAAGIATAGRTMLVLGDILANATNEATSAASRYLAPVSERLVESTNWTFTVNPWNFILDNPGVALVLSVATVVLLPRIIKVSRMGIWGVVH